MIGEKYWKSPLTKAILDVVNEHDGITVNEIVEITNKAQPHINKRLNLLVKNGDIKKVYDTYETMDEFVRMGRKQKRKRTGRRYLYYSI